MMRIEKDVALIDNPLLRAAIWGDQSCLYKSVKFTGYVQASIDKIGKAFIEYCIARALGIYRLPNCGYDYYTDTSVLFNSLPEEDINAACEEMEQVIKHVQKKLNESKLVKNGKISVVRCLSHYQLEDATEQLLDESCRSVTFPVSILSSYSYDGNENEIYPSGRTETGQHINIREDVSVSDIVLWDQYVGDGGRECIYCKSMYDEERELWVVDRSINGMMTLPRECFLYSDGLPDTNRISRFRSFGKDSPLCSGLYQKRPCEYEDFLTKIVMKKNKAKLEAEYIETKRR